MDALAPGFALAPLDSARVVSTVYSLSLVSTVPFVGAALAAFALRRASAGTRVLVWRATVVTILLLAVAQLVPSQWEAWIVPMGLAEPLIVLGRHAVRTGVGAGSALDVNAGSPRDAVIVAGLGIIYFAGVVAVLWSTFRGIVAARRLAASGARVDDREWLTVADEVRRALCIARPVPLLATARCAVPMAAGVWRPVVLLPVAMLGMPRSERRAVLLHELAHVRAGDVAYALAARVACALFWFHPGAWWIAARLRDESELACDDRVIDNGVRPSEYAALLADMADRLCGTRVSLATALTGQGGLRARLAAITAVGLDRRAPGRFVAAVSLAVAVALAAPLGVLKLEPTRHVLESLMEDGRWESRAYAAIGLAPRADSLAVTQHAATSDPNPHVRALASYALSQHAPAREDLPALVSPARR